MNKKRNRKGFSLIELLVVVAIILVIAAIAVPNLLKAKAAANGAAGVGALRTLNTAMFSYNTTFSQYPATITDLQPPATAGAAATVDHADLIDANLASATKSGYTFSLLASPSGCADATEAAGVITASATPCTSYTINADPITNPTVAPHYATDQSGAIYEKDGATAAIGQNPL